MFFHVPVLVLKGIRFTTGNMVACFSRGLKQMEVN